jgi:alpha-ketoglutarate-dependent dioxygenase FTO
MMRDFNAHHHHAVLTGNTRRFSSTHRVAVMARDTFEYIKGRCEAALKLLPVGLALFTLLCCESTQ